MAFARRRREDGSAPARDGGAVADRPTRARSRWSRRDRTRGAAEPTLAERGAYAAGGGLALVARAIALVVTLVVLLIAAGVLLYVLGANASNTIVRDVHDGARWLVGPFDGMFRLHSAKGSLALNWGIAAVVYMVVGSMIARFIGAGAARARLRRA